MKKILTYRQSQQLIKETNFLLIDIPQILYNIKIVYFFYNYVCYNMAISRAM